MANTTKVLLYNTSNNEILIFGDKNQLSNYLGINHNTLINYFRGGNKIVNIELSGVNYIIYKADKYISSTSRNKIGGFK